MWSRSHALRSSVAVIVVVVGLVGPSCRGGGGAPPVDFAGLRPYETRTAHRAVPVTVFTLDNGLRVALAPDPRTNLVGVDVLYQVGNGDDPAERSGLAHLVEHASFRIADPAGGTLFDQLGLRALYFNASTGPETTTYTSVGLGDELDALLALEARRLAFDCGRIDAADFARERDVVLAEEAERFPAGTRLAREIAAAVWGRDHPYARRPGERQVATATLGEVCAFAAAHHGAASAVVVVTGAFDVDHAMTEIRARFGAIAAGAVAPRAAAPARPFSGSSDHAGDLDGELVRVYYATPEPGGVVEVAVELLRRRLDAAAVSRDWLRAHEVATVGAGASAAVMVELYLSRDAHVAEAIAVVDRATGDLLRGPAAELDEVRGAVHARRLVAADRFGGRGAAIATMVATTPARAVATASSELATVDAAELAARVTAWFQPERRHVARVGWRRDRRAPPPVLPASSGTVHAVEPWRAAVDPASARRPLAPPPEGAPAAVEDHRLPNGLRVVLAPDPRSEVVEARLVFPVGTDADDPEQPGLAELAAVALGHDLARAARDPRLVWALGRGADVAAAVSTRTTTFTIRGEGIWADWHLWRLAWLLEDGVYDRLDELHASTRTYRAEDAAAFLMRQKLFGAGHRYGRAEPLPDILLYHRRHHLEAFRAARYRPRGATLIVTGGFDAAAIRSQVAALFGDWADVAPPAVPPTPPPAPEPGPSWIAMHRDGAAQGEITLGFAAAADRNAARAARVVLTHLLEERTGVIREGLGVSYGAAVGYGPDAMADLFRIEVRVDGRRTAEILGLLLDELGTLRDRPDQLAAAFVRARQAALAAALAEAGGASALADTLEARVGAGLALDRADGLAAEIAALTLDDLAAHARRDLAVERMVVIVRGAPVVVDGALAALPHPPASVVTLVDE